MRFLHSMVRVKDLDESLKFYTDILGLEEKRRKEVESGRFTLVFLGSPNDHDDDHLELTYNWDPEEYDNGRNFGHLAYVVADIYKKCEELQAKGVTINRPPRDGRMAFIKSPDGISIELLQEGVALPPKEPWASMENTGTW